MEGAEAEAAGKADRVPAGPVEQAGAGIGIPPSTWRLRLLGGFSLERGGRRLVRLHSRAAVLLLARLALQPQRDHAREELAGWLWPEAEARTGLARLRQTLSTLKALLERGDGALPAGTLIDADRQVLRLVPGALVCDVVQFETACRRKDGAEAARWYGGELLPGHYDDWVVQERLRLEALADPLVPTAGPLPLAVQGPAQAPASPSIDPLPQYLTPSFGGEAQARALADAVDRWRLVVVRGAGGIGKTRLAVTAARMLRVDQRMDAACFVPWAGQTGLPEASRALAVALGVPTGAVDGQSPATVVDAVCRVLAERRALVVLDNCEQCDAPVLDLVPALLGRLPGLHLLLTSRRSLGLTGEHEWQPEPLACPPPGASQAEALTYPAVQLFVERARARRPDFQLHAGNGEAIIRVTRVLGGLPLALELGAALVRTLPPGRLAEHLEAAGAARWRLLARRGAGAREVPRQASMAAVVEGSLALLTPQARTWLQTVAVLPLAVPGSLLEVCGAPVEVIDELVGHGLLVPTPGAETGPGDLEAWWRPPEPVRDLVAESLPPDAQAPALAAWRQALIDWAPSLAPAWPLATLDRLVPLLLAVMAPPEAAPEPNLHLLLAFAAAWQERSLPARALAALDRAFELEPEDAAGPDPQAGWRSRVHVLGAAANLAAGRREVARLHAAQAQRLLPEAPVERARTALTLARVAWRADADGPRARLHLQQARAAAEDGGDAAPAALLASIENFAATLSNEADHDPRQADAAYRQALRHLAAEPEAHGHMRRGLRYNLAITAVYAGRPADALAELGVLQAEADRAGDRHLLAQVLNAMGSALQALGRLREAQRATRAALAEAWATLETENALYALWNLGPLALQQHEPERAARLMAFADRYWRTHFGELGPTDARDVARLRRCCRQQLGRETGQRCWREGAALSLPAAVALALS